MAGQYDDSGQVPHLFLDEGGGNVVEVVGRLVQQQCAGPPDQERGQRQPAALPAGERGERPVVPEGAEAETVEHELGAPVRVPGLPVLGLFEQGAIGGEQLRVLGRVLRGLREPFGEAVQLGEVVPGLAQRLVQYVGNRRVGVVRQLLLQKAQVGRAGDAAGVGFVDSREQAQQGRLADAVLADESDTAPGGGGQGDAVEHSAAVEVAHEIVCEQGRLRHGSGPSDVIGARPAGRQASDAGQVGTPADHTSGAPVSVNSPSASRSHRPTPISRRNRSSWLTTTKAP